jgi:hypothetical protein
MSTRQAHRGRPAAGRARDRQQPGQEFASVTVKLISPPLRLLRPGDAIPDAALRFVA